MKYRSETILPFNSEERKGSQIKRMFDAIASSYDLLNHAMSFGFDKSWRNKGVATLKPYAPQTILDIATGTGDLAILMYQKLHPQKVVGADISEGMMDVGRTKVEKKGLSSVISFEYQDCTQLTFADNSFDAITASFGVRNFEDTEKGLKEMCRVLNKDGRLMILELSTPEYFPMKQLYQLYSNTVMPLLGRCLSKQKEAYTYLPQSIKVVPQGEVMKSLLEDCGFSDVAVKTFTFGVCSLYTGTKK